MRVDAGAFLRAVRCALFFALLTAPAAALTFENVSDRLPEAAHLAGVGGDRDDDSWSAVAADFDNDGWTNLFVANQTGDSRLYRNDGDGTFTNVTEAAGLAGIQGVPVAEADLDLGDAPAGVYLVRATSVGEVAMRPIVLTE